MVFLCHGVEGGLRVGDGGELQDGREGGARVLRIEIDLSRDEGLVREEARKAETVFSAWGVDEVDRIRQNWEKNGGESINLSPADAQRYLDEVGAVVGPLLAKNPQVKEDHEALQAAAKPEKTDFLFFVAKGDGSGDHAFAKTIEEQEANRVKYGNK